MDDGVVRSGSLAYLVLTGDTPRFLCVSETFSGGRAPKFAEARLCTRGGLVSPVVVRGCPFTSRSSSLSDGTALGANVFLTIESSQSPPGQGHPLRLALGTGGDAAMVDEMRESGFPTPGLTSAASLVSNVPMQTPLFMASSLRPEHSVFLLIGIRDELYYGMSFQLLSRAGYLCGSLDDRLALQLEPTSGCSWKLLPFANFYSPFADGCLAHLPNPTSLLAITCSLSGCTASGRNVYLSEKRCEQEGHDAGDEQPESRV